MQRVPELGRAQGGANHREGWLPAQRARQARREDLPPSGFAEADAERIAAGKGNA